MKCGEPPLQVHMRLPRATDEPHGPRAGPVAAHGLLLCSLDRAVQCQAQIIVGIHAQKRAISMALEEIARPFAIASSYDAGDHGFCTLEPPRSFKLLKALIEDRLEPDRRHVLPPNLVRRIAARRLDPSLQHVPCHSPKVELGRPHPRASAALIVGCG